MNVIIVVNLLDVITFIKWIIRILEQSCHFHKIQQNKYEFELFRIDMRNFNF